MKKYLNVDENFDLNQFYCENTKVLFFINFQFKFNDKHLHEFCDRN